ncbi:FecR domain-containing protein [Arcobacter lanthieri]|uniref:FecR family protein n=1 Tax=Aliarcobacter lanthieri TaxID=1355374 RepID=UPI001923F318|nr:FecR domain-containing protein [Aliarcobacter lanthieri]MBL3520213.1 FecR domain-containing protein [Aliarcobacter lanthieri]
MTNKDTIVEKARYYLSCEQEGKDIYSNQGFLIWINIKENKEVFEEEKLFRQLFINIPKQYSSKLSEQVQQELKRERFLNKIKKSTAIAACFLVISFVYIFYFKDNYSQNIYSQNMIMQDITMPDDSKITLDVKSNIEIEYTKNKREVFLKYGKAIFEVSANKGRPFYVQSNDISVKVVGTKFEVNQKKNSVNIAVLDGIVDINYKDLKISELKKGDSLEVFNNGEILSLKNLPVENLASWKEGKLIFEKTPLIEVLNEFQRYIDKRIKLVVSRNDDFLITGEFKIDEFDKFTKLLPMIYPIKVEYIGEKKVLFKN